MFKSLKILLPKIKGVSELIENKLIEKGFKVNSIEVGRLSILNDWNNIDKEIVNLDKYDWIIFTSKTGVNLFFDRIETSNINLHELKLKFAAVGSKTANEIIKHGFNVSFIPEIYTTYELGNNLPLNQGNKILLIRSKLSNDELEKILIRRGFQVKTIYAYQIAFVKSNYDENEIINCDLVIFTSSSMILGLINFLDKDTLEIVKNKCAVACIGPITKESAEKFGFKVKIVPKRYTIDDLINEIEKFYGNIKSD